VSVTFRHVINPFEPATSTLETQEAWAGITLADVESRASEPVEIAVNGMYVPSEIRGSVHLVDGDVVVLIPAMGLGRNVIGMVGMAALAMFAPAIGGMLGTMSAGFGMAATGLATQIFTVGTMIGGAMIVSAMVGVKGSKSDKPMYTLSPKTTQQVGGMCPVYYGKTKVTGNVIACWTEHTNTTDTVNDMVKLFMNMPTVLAMAFGRAVPTSAEQVLAATEIKRTTETLYCLLDLGTGPVNGIVAGSMRINGRPATDYSGLTITEYKGTLDQSAPFAETKIERRPMIEVTATGGAITWTTPDAHADRLEIALYLEKGLYGISESDGDRVWHKMGYKIEISEAGAASWSTLVDDVSYGMTSRPLWITFDTDVDYTGGSPVTITYGKQYDIKVTKTTTDRNDDYHGDSLRIGAVREVLETAFTYPGRVLVAIEALASKELGGVLEFEAELEGQIVAHTTTGALTYSDDPGAICQHILTGPVISGDGDGTPYAVEQYDGVPIGRISAADMQALTDYSNDAVDDGKGSTENRVTINGPVAGASNRWEVAGFVAGLARAALVRRGQTIGLFIDKATAATYCFSDVNMIAGSYRDQPIPQDQRASEINCDFPDRDADYMPTRMMYCNSNIDTVADATIDCSLLVKRSEVSRHAKWLSAKNQYIGRCYSWQSFCDALAVEVGDVCYLRRYPAGRATAKTTNTVTIDTPIPAGTWTRLIHKAASGGTESMTTYTVTNVTGQVLTISGTFSPAVSVDDVIILGPTTISSNLCRITRVDPSDDCIAQVEAVDYVAAVYTADASPTFGTIQALQAASGTTALAGPVTKLEDQINWAMAGSSPDLSILPHIHSGTFSNAGSGKVSWTAFTVTYLGTDYAVAANAVGTTNDYIYWDSTSTAAFSSSNDLDDAKGATKWLVCYNDDGEPNAAGGSLLLSLGDGAVTEAKIADGAVTTNKLGALAVSAAKLAAAAVETAKIQDEATTEGGNSVSTSTVYITDGKWWDIASLTITSTGDPVEITGGGPAQNTSSFSTRSIVYRVYSSTDAFEIGRTEESIPPSTTETVVLAVYSHKPAAGSHTYKLQGKQISGEDVDALAGCFILVRGWRGK